VAWFGLTAETYDTWFTYLLGGMLAQLDSCMLDLNINLRLQTILLQLRLCLLCF